jgi:hypothetical protein
VAAGPFHAREFCIQKTSIFVYKIAFIHRGNATAPQQGFFTTTKQYIVFITVLHRKRLTKLSISAVAFQQILHPLLYSKLPLHTVKPPQAKEHGNGSDGV